MVTLGAAKTVTVVHGIHRLDLPLAGRAVGGARQALAPILNIGPDTLAVVNGAEVGEDFILAPEDLLEFVRLAGEKGAVVFAGGR